MPPTSRHLPEGEAVPASPLPRYDAVLRRLESDRCVILDGATGTELIDSADRRPDVEEELWGVTHIVDAPAEVQAVHRRYVDAGCHVLTTNTWGLATGMAAGSSRPLVPAQPIHWMDVARAGVELARGAAAESNREDVAVAFSINADLEGPEASETVRLIDRAISDSPPDLLLVETLSIVKASTYDVVAELLSTGLPVWLSFRRCRQGLCGVYGEHWGGPEGDSFGRAAHRFEGLGVGAVLVNCIPPDHVTGMVSWLRDFTDVPLGVYPNLGNFSAGGWRGSSDVDEAAFADMALQWRDEGAQIVGGCCGVGPGHIKAAAGALEGRPAGRARPEPTTTPREPRKEGSTVSWTDGGGKSIFPVSFPSMSVEPGVPVPSPMSTMLWKHLVQERIGSRLRCLDVGCGAGLLSVQLLRNGATHVHAIDISEAAVANTRVNASRSDRGARLTASAADVYPWVPEERYDVVVADVPQVPVDPLQATSHRATDFWGRNLFDHLLAMLPDALAPDGVAYVTQLSIIGQQRTDELLASLGLSAQTVDYAIVRSSELLGCEQQLERVGVLSDAYHLRLGDQVHVVAYLLKIVPTRARGTSWRLPD